MNVNYLIISAPNIPKSDPSILIEPVDALTLATWAKLEGTPKFRHSFYGFEY